MEQAWEVRIPDDVQELLNDGVASEALGQAVEDGVISCRVNLRTGLVVYSLAARHVHPVPAA